LVFVLLFEDSVGNLLLRVEKSFAGHWSKRNLASLRKYHFLDLP